MKPILEEYRNLFDQIKAKPDFDLGLAQDLVFKMQSLGLEQKFSLLPLFKEIEEFAFEKGSEIPNLDFNQLKEEAKIWEGAKTNAKTKIKEEKRINLDDDFNRVLFHFSAKYELVLNRVKGFFVFRLQNSDNLKNKVSVLFDEDFTKHPEINSFDINETQYELKKYQIQEFINLVSKDAEFKNQNYLIVILVTSRLKDGQDLVKKITTLIDSFSNGDFVIIKKRPISSYRDFEFKTTTEGLTRIECHSNKIFNNRELTFEEETIIKQLFSGKEMILDYKILKGGNSGSKVIEIQPLKVDHPLMSRFVVKFSPINAERKIQIEKEKFNIHISDIGVTTYVADYYYNETHEAIKYKYASSDGKNDSYPFSKLINDYISKDYPYPFSLETVIDELFNCDPFKVWNTGRYHVQDSVKDLYSEYLKSERKILNKISLIKGISIDQVNNLELIRNYNIIKDFNLKTNKKICHGDLHSENFFKDEKGVYLIDFGWTDKHHSLIDHATLECSIKFKHLPFYIPIEELVSYEERFLAIDSFSKDSDLSHIQRPIIKDLFKIISLIREKSKEFLVDKCSPLEYLISLFIINFRQIQYADLNQQYAISSAEILSKEILKLISTYKS